MTFGRRQNLFINLHVYYGYRRKRNRLAEWRSSKVVGRFSNHGETRMKESDSWKSNKELKITGNAWKLPWNLLLPVLPGVDENGHAVSPGYFMTQISSRHVGIPLFLFRLSRRTAFSPSPPPPPPRPALKIPSVSPIETSCVSGAIKRCCSFAVRPRGKYIGSAGDKRQDRETVVSIGSSLTE